jgi:hypothetical protein
MDTNFDLDFLPPNEASPVETHVVNPFPNDSTKQNTNAFFRNGIPSEEYGFLHSL